jgi:hypothetical protein
VGIFRRFNDYGITVNRLLMIIFNAWMYAIALYLIINRSKKIKTIFISFAIIAFLSAIGPWSVFAIARHSVYNRLEQNFDRYHLLKSGKAGLTNKVIVKIDSATFEQMQSALEYMCRTYGNKSIQPLFKDSLGRIATYYSAVEILKAAGIESVKHKYESGSLDICPENQVIDMNSYKQVLHFDLSANDSKTISKNNITITLKNNTVTIKRIHQSDIVIPMTDAIRLFDKLNKAKQIAGTDDTTISGTNYKLVVFSLHADIGLQVKLNRMEALLLY